MLVNPEKLVFIKKIDRNLFVDKKIYDREAILLKWQEELTAAVGLAFILDLDENLFDTVNYWVAVTNRLLRLKFGVTVDKLPLPQQVYVEGGPSSYYYKHFPEIFPTFDSYELIIDELRHRTSPNLLPKKMHSNMDNLLDQLQDNGLLLGGLTARPDNLHTVTATARQFQKNLSRHTSPVIVHRRISTPMAQAGQEKLQVLDHLSTTANEKAILALIDDSLSTALILSVYNIKAREKGLKPIIQFVNGIGQLTAPKLESEAQLFANNSGIFLMKDWDNLPEVIQEAQTWLLNNHK